MVTTTKKQYEKIASLGCVLCHHLNLGHSLAECHHIRRLGGKRDLSPVIPLCPEHHRGNSGVHGMGRKAFSRHYGVTEEDLLAQTEELIAD